jgi:hypothetical protein
MVGIAAIVVYEKFPLSNPDSFPDVPRFNLEVDEGRL